MVEFALIAPLLLLVLFGIVEFARLGLAFAEIRTAAREGARYATVVGDSDGNGLPNFVDCDGIKAAALAKVVTQALSPADIDVDHDDSRCLGSQPEGDIDTGTEIKVTANARFQAIVPLVGQFLDGLDISSAQARTINYGAVTS